MNIKRAVVDAVLVRHPWAESYLSIRPGQRVMNRARRARKELARRLGVTNKRLRKLEKRARRVVKKWQDSGASE